MGKKKCKIPKLTDEQYVKYIMSLKDDPSLYSADGSIYVPDSLCTTEENKTGE